MSLGLKQLLLLSFLTFLREIHGKRGFDIIMHSLNCTANPKYISESRCFVDKTLHPPRAFADIQLIRELRQVNYSLEVVFLRAENDPVTMISVKDGDACKFLQGNVEATLVKIYRDALAEAGELPKCPIGKDYHFVFKDIKADAERFPPYVPDADFGIRVHIKVDQDIVISIRLDGSIVRKNKKRLG